MIQSEVRKWLDENQHAGSKAHVISHQPETRTVLDHLGVLHESEVGYFYLNYGPSAVRGWYELNEVDQIQDCTDYVRGEFDVPDEYLALKSMEGQGVVLYHRCSQAVYDVDFGRFDDLISGSLPPITDSFSGFLSWCKSNAEAG